MRIGWRSIRRSRGRSALVVLLVMLPVAGMAAAITLAATVAPTREASATRAMGAADFAVQMQLPGGTTDALLDLLPAGAVVEAVSYDDPVLVLPGREVTLNAHSMDLDGLARGKLVITDGRQPERGDEIAVSASVAALAGVGIGDRIELKGWGRPTIVGLVEDPSDIRFRLVLQPARVAQELGDGQNEQLNGSVWWLVALPADLEGSVLDEGEVACGRDGCQFFAVPRTQISGQSPEVTIAILVFGALVLVEALLIASAAFAVGVRRRQRELGLLAAAGAERRHLAATVLSEGVLLGGLGALLGVALGVGVIGAASPWLDELTNKRNPPVTIDLLGLLLAGSLGSLACLLAAAVPAWSAARLPVLLALSGRRPALSPARRMLVVGLALVISGAVLTSTGAAMRLSDPGGMMSVIFMVVGAIIGVLGFGACSPWLIERLERLGLVLPPTVRMALRDTARARSRNSPIVTAILATFAATVALSTYFASNDAAAAANWQPWLRPDQIVVRGEGAVRAGPDAAAGLGAMAGAPIRALVGVDGREVYAVMEARTGDEFQTEFGVAVGDAELLTALGAEAAASDLARGNVVLLTREPTDMQSLTAVVRDADSGKEISSVTLPATVVVTGISQGGVPEAIMSTATADRLGFTSAGEVWTYVIRLPRPATEADVARAATFAAQYDQTSADASLGPTRGDALFRTVLVVVSLLFALSVTAVAVALGEAESRPDQRTLLAIGADPGIRRRIAAARAGVITLLAGVLAVPAGLLPAWGLLGSRDAPLVVPIPEVLAAVVILPLAGIVGALVLSRRIPAWSALREASS
jgi:putative ABC transport system permease protein